MKLAVVIPTRHRSELAIAAIESLLTQPDAALSVVVSDNSTEESHVQRLREFCAASADPRLLYLRPPEALAMAAHWDWALAQAVGRTAATHFGIHYDRKLWKPGSIGHLASACARQPEWVTAYPCDFTFASADGFIAWQFPASGNLYAIETERVIAATVAGRFGDIGQPTPLLSNCMVPLAVLERIREVFGTMCGDSTSPDTAFTYRLCAVAARYAFLDRALSVMYEFAYSNGLAYFRGDTSAAFGDFMKLHGSRPWLDAGLIPGLTLGTNTVYHEYNMVRRHPAGHRLPPLDEEGCLRELALGLAYVPDDAERARLREILEQHGWREDPPPPPPQPPPQPPLWRRVASRLLRPLRARPRIEPPPAPPPAPDPTFATEREAVELLLTDAPQFAEHNPLLDFVAATPIDDGEDRC